MRSEADHPAPAELLAVYLGTLDPEERDPIEEHLSKCPECAQTVLDFEAFPHLRAVDEGDAEVTRRLEDQKRRLIERSREETFERNETSQRSRSVPWFASPAVAWGVAAVFFLATVGLGVWHGGERLREGGAIAPVAEGVVVQQRGPEDELKKIALAGEATLVRLILQGYARDHVDYRVLLKDRSGDEVSSTPVSELYEGDSLLVTVPHRILSAGVYHFEVRAVEDGEDIRVGSLDVEFVDPETGAAPE